MVRVGEMVMQTGVQSDGRLGVTQATGEIELGALGRALWRKKFLIVGLTLIAALLAFAAVNYITPRYKSEARVLIEPARTSSCGRTRRSCSSAAPPSIRRR